MNTAGVEPLFFDPMRSWPEFGENPARLKLLCCSIIVVISQDTGEQVDDGRVALVAV